MIKKAIQGSFIGCKLLIISNLHVLAESGGIDLAHLCNVLHTKHLARKYLSHLSLGGL